MKAKNSRFQVSLATCIILMFVAGVMIRENLQPPQILDTREHAGQEICSVDFREMGWPWANTITYGFDNKLSAEEAVELFYKNRLPEFLPLNIVTNFFLLGMVAFSSELFIRRFRKQKMVQDLA